MSAPATVRESQARSGRPHRGRGAVLPAVLATALAPLLALAAVPERAEVERAVARAERAWDVDAAVAALSRARELARAAPTPAATALHVRAGLLAAELLRVDFEQAAAASGADRETLGRRIDALAEEALALLPSLPPTSERWRVEADLVATMIRSDFRAKKFEARLRAAIAEARRLDPANARALVSEAKPFLFAPEGRGRDLRAGIALLNRALALDPKLEPAMLLRALAHSALGERAAAEADWRAVLAANPACRPAREALAAPGAAAR